MEKDYTEASVNKNFLPQISLRDINTVQKEFPISPLPGGNETKGDITPEEIYTALVEKGSKNRSEKNRHPGKLLKPGQDLEVDPVIKIILAILLPPLAVFLHEGIGTYFWISLILTILGWFPGVIFALLVVLDKI